MYKISNEKLPLLFAAIAENMDLYMPLEKNGQVNYGIWTKDDKAALDALNASGKTIGVISHVEAMKERIPVQIKVKKINGLGYSKLESTFAVK
jgi:hypothetical protein